MSLNSFLQFSTLNDQTPKPIKPSFTQFDGSFPYKSDAGGDILIVAVAAASAK